MRLLDSVVRLMRSSLRSDHLHLGREAILSDGLEESKPPTHAFSHEPQGPACGRQVDPRSELRGFHGLRRFVSLSEWEDMGDIFVRISCGLTSGIEGVTA